LNASKHEDDCLTDLIDQLEDHQLAGVYESYSTKEAVDLGSTERFLEKERLCKRDDATDDERPSVDEFDAHCSRYSPENSLSRLAFSTSPTWRTERHRLLSKKRVHLRQFVPRRTIEEK